MTTVREKAPSILTAEGARRLTARIRDAAVLTDNMLARAYEGRVWEALDYADFREWQRKEIPSLQFVKLRKGPRQALVAEMLADGRSQREMAEATGASLGTINADVQTLERSELNTAPSPAAQPSAEPCKWEIVARQVAAAGERGLTCLELEKKLRWRHGSASGAFRAAELKGHIRRDGRFREQYGTYVMR